jgi:hypothetical protein
LSLDPAADFCAGSGQRAHIFSVERRQAFADALREPGVGEELPKRVGGGGEAGRHAHALGQLRDHFAEAGVLAADRVDV